MCLWAFSIMMIAASTIAPMAMAMPPSDMMLALMPCIRMTTKAIRIAVGRVKIATSALRTWSRKTMLTSATMMDSSTSLLAQGLDGPLDEARAVVGGA